MLPSASGIAFSSISSLRAPFGATAKRWDEILKGFGTILQDFRTILETFGKILKPSGILLQGFGSAP